MAWGSVITREPCPSAEAGRLEGGAGDAIQVRDPSCLEIGQELGESVTSGTLPDPPEGLQHLGRNGDNSRTHHPGCFKHEVRFMGTQGLSVQVVCQMLQGLYVCIRVCVRVCVSERHIQRER